MDPKQTGDLGHGLAVPLDELTGMGDLLGCEGRGTPRALATIRPALVRSTIRDCLTRTRTLFLESHPRTTLL